MLAGYFRLATAKKNLNQLDAAADTLKVGDFFVILARALMVVFTVRSCIPSGRTVFISVLFLYVPATK